MIFGVKKEVMDFGLVSLWMTGGCKGGGENE